MVAALEMPTTSGAWLIAKRNVRTQVGPTELLLSYSKDWQAPKLPTQHC